MAVKKAISKKAAKGGKPTPKAKPLTNKPNDGKTKKNRGAIVNGSTGVQFSKENQPSPEAKAAGKFRAKTLRQLLESPLAKGRLPKDMQEILQEMYKAYGISKEQIDVRLFMDMKMITQAIKSGDVSAYKAVLDRVYGRPREEQAPMVETPQDDGDKTKFILPGGIELEL